MPELTYVVPVYNGGEFIQRALDSILGQSHEPAKIVVVDDGSTDDTPRIVSRYKDVTMLRQPNKGVSAARNRGLEAVQTEIVCFVDADDYIIGPHRRSVEMKWNRDVDIIVGLAAQGDDSGAWLAMTNKYDVNSNAVTLLDHFINDNCVQTSHLCWSTRFLRQIGGWDETLSGIDDIELAMRAFLHGARVIVSNEPGWVVWYDHPGPTRVSKNKDRTAASQLAANKKLLHLIEEKQCNPVIIENFLRRCLREARSLYMNGYPKEARELFNISHQRGFTVHQGPRVEAILGTVFGMENVLFLRRNLGIAKRAVRRSAAPRLSRSR